MLLCQKKNMHCILKLFLFQLLQIILLQQIIYKNNTLKMKYILKICIIILIITILNAYYVTTCHNDNQCGTICGTKGPDTVAPTQGALGVSCKCQNGQPPVHQCTKDGIDVKVCSDRQPPSCTTNMCNQKICIKMNGKQATGTVRSACPKYHPVNADQCCKYGGSYCCCVKEPVLDINYQPYGQLGGQNGYTTGVTIGACGNSDTGIDVDSEQGRQWIKKNAKQCQSVILDIKIPELRQQDIQAYEAQ